MYAYIYKLQQYFTIHDEFLVTTGFINILTLKGSMLGKEIN